MDDQTPKKEKLNSEIKGMLLAAAGIFVLVALASFSSDDLSFNSFSTGTVVHNFGGKLGAQVSDMLFQAFGVASYIVAGAMLYTSYRLLRFKELKITAFKLLAFLGLLVSMSTLFAFNMEFTSLFGQRVQTGGAIGYKTAVTLKGFLGVAGALLLLFPVLAASITIMSRFSFVLFTDWWINTLTDRWALYREKKALNSAIMKDEKINIIKDKPEPVIKPVQVNIPVAPKSAKKEKQEADKLKPLQELFDFAKSDDGFRTPPLSLLDATPASSRKVDKELLTMNARLLEKKLRDFGVDGEVVEICPGPVVTMYEFAPGPGIKVSKIAGLADDLSMALQALSIRIVAPIPGKGVVGIELPNRDREMVSLKEIFTSEEFQKGKFKLPLALGKDIAGLPLVTDLARMPHLLVAGATGSGKSVSINTMILSLLYTYTPKDVRIIMVDPKMLELSVYDGIPHLLLPVVTNPKKASISLKWGVEEMGRRYRLMADKGVRNIDSYNKALEKEEKEIEELRTQDIVSVDDVIDPEDDQEAIQAFLDKEEVLEHGHLPYIVVIVDELADLMMVAGREIEESIARLAQMARAAGIHLILATQRPSVDVITGLIKANFPARVSFQVSSKTDSRTILDCNGAESLLGAGDMLFLPPGTSKLQRSHGAFVSDAEVQRVVDFLKKQGKPVYDKSILTVKAGDDKGDGDDEEMDERYDDAVALVAEAKQASISMIQRRLRIGYNRAARIIEKMESEGIVGPSDGTSKPREVFINRQ